MDRRIFLGGAAAVAAAGGAALWLGSGNDAGGTTAFSVNAQESDIDTSGIIEMAMGAEDAPVTLVEYASFTCPHCANFHANAFKPLKSEFVDTGKVRFVYRDVYFDRFGLWASLVARCGGEDRFFGIADMLYDQQKEWLESGDPAVITGNLRRIGKIAGLSDGELDACLADAEKAQALVAWFQKNASDDDISATPTLIIDGEKFPNMSYPDLRDVLNKKLDA